MNERILRKAENEIRVGIKSIRDGNKTVKESNLGSVLNAMKLFDEVLYDELFNLYKKALSSPFCKK